MGGTDRDVVSLRVADGGGVGSLEALLTAVNAGTGGGAICRAAGQLSDFGLLCACACSRGQATFTLNCAPVVGEPDMHHWKVIAELISAAGEFVARRWAPGPYRSARERFASGRANCGLRPPAPNSGGAGRWRFVRC